MKYTLNVIDTEEKFKEKFGSEPQWVISTPLGYRTSEAKEKSEPSESAQNEKRKPSKKPASNSP